MRPTVLLFAACCVFAAEPKPSAPKPPQAKAETPVAAVAKPVTPPAPAATAPKPKAESLHFNVNWPSGLSLGEGDLISTPTSEGWNFSVKAEFAIPAFAVVESAKSKAGPDLCSLELVKDGSRGKRKIDEKTVFDSSKLLATRTTGNNGGKSEMRTPACARDALTFIQFARRELAAGRLPQAQPVYYGAAYQTRVQYTGTQKIRAGNEYVECDKLTATVKGPSSELTLDLFFARDAARTPVVVQIPVAMGKFSLEFDR